MTPRTRQQGFTLIEAAVAIAVVAILSGIIVPLVVKNLQDSQIARAKNDVQVIAAAIASQIKDTGTRPSAASGPGSSTGVGSVSWQSSTAAVTGVTLTASNNTFTNLFTNKDVSGTAPGNTLFGTTFGSEFSYKGPYLAPDVTAKSDPWGKPYFILGYSATNLGTGGPIWVVSAGPNGAVTTGSTIASLEVLATWATDTNAADDIVVRVN